MKLRKDRKRSRTLTCGTATDRQSTRTFCRRSELETEKEDELLTSCSDKCFVRVLRLTWCTSSAATLKLQVLDVDLEILLLSFLAPILWDDSMSFHRRTVAGISAETFDFSHTHTYLSLCPASGELGLDGTSDFTSSVWWQPSKLLCSLRRLENRKV